jgi:hypothetical protein
MALSEDMGFWINTAIYNKLEELCPMLDLRGEDHRVYEICTIDFKNYVRYITSSHPKMEDCPIDSAFGEPFVTLVINNLTGTIHRNMQNTKEVIEFIDIWVKWWWRKWQERTKVIFSAEDIPKNSISGGDSPVMNTVLTPEQQSELRGIVTEKLIQFGEICCTEVIAAHLMKKEIEDMKSYTVQSKIQLIPLLQRKARDISYIHGPLVFIQVGSYLKLREWRNDGTMSKVF